MYSCWQTMVSNILLQNHFVFSVAHTPRSANTLHLVGAHSKQNLWYGGLKRYNKAVNINCNHQQLRRKLLPQKENAKIEIYPNYSSTYFYLSSYLHSSQGCVKQHTEKNKCLVRKKCGWSRTFGGLNGPRLNLWLLLEKNAEIVDIPSSRIFSRGSGESQRCKK